MFTVPPDSNTVCVPLAHMDPAIMTASFQQACQSRGLLVPDPLIADGQFQRFGTNGKSTTTQLIKEAKANAPKPAHTTLRERA